MTTVKSIEVNGYLKFDTIPNDGGVNSVFFAPKYSVICSVGEAAFHGSVNIFYEPIDRLIELESFEHSLHQLALTNFTVESFCAYVFDSILETLGGANINLDVEVNAETIRHSPVSARKIQKS